MHELRQRNIFGISNDKLYRYHSDCVVGLLFAMGYQLPLRHTSGCFGASCFLGTSFGSSFFCSRKLNPTEVGAVVVAVGGGLVAPVLRNRGLEPFCSVFVAVLQLLSSTAGVVVAGWTVWPLAWNTGAVGLVAEFVNRGGWTVGAVVDAVATAG